MHPTTLLYSEQTKYNNNYFQLCYVRQTDRRRRWVMSTVRLFHRFIRFFGVLLLTTMAALDDTSLKSRLATKGRKR